MAQLIKNLPAVQETQAQSLGWEDPLEDQMAAHSNGLENPSDGRAREETQITESDTTERLTLLLSFHFHRLTLS